MNSPQTPNDLNILDTARWLCGAFHFHSIYLSSWNGRKLNARFCSAPPAINYLTRIYCPFPIVWDALCILGPSLALVAADMALFFFFLTLFIWWMYRCPYVYNLSFGRQLLLPVHVHARPSWCSIGRGEKAADTSAGGLDLEDKAGFTSAFFSISRFRQRNRNPTITPEPLHDWRPTHPITGSVWFLYQAKWCRMLQLFWWNFQSRCDPVLLGKSWHKRHTHKTANWFVQLCSYVWDLIEVAQFLGFCNFKLLLQ